MREIERGEWYHWKTLDGKFLGHWDRWPEFLRKGHSEKSAVFRPSKSKENK